MFPIPPTIVFIVLIPMVCIAVLAYKCITAFTDQHLIIPEEMLYL